MYGNLHLACYVGLWLIKVVFFNPVLDFFHLLSVNKGERGVK